VFVLDAMWKDHVLFCQRQQLIITKIGPSFVGFLCADL